MEGTKRRAANSLGMFDLLKGVGMLTIVFAHTGELYPMGDASHINPLTFCMFAYRESLMAAFYIASGYGVWFPPKKVLLCAAPRPGMAELPDFWRIMLKIRDIYNKYNAF